MTLDQETFNQLLAAVDKFVEQRLKPLESSVAREAMK